MIPNADQVVFVDIETTGLDPDRHEVWEVALIVPTDADGSSDDEWVFRFRPEHLETADQYALNLTGYWDRRCWGYEAQTYRNGMDLSARKPSTTQRAACVARIRELTWGRHLVGAVPSFDAIRLERLLHAAGEPVGWHYHLIDVEALAVGRLAGDGVAIPLPWRSDDLYRALGVDVEMLGRHEALGDARLARDVYRAALAPRCEAPPRQDGE